MSICTASVSGGMDDSMKNIMLSLCVVTYNQEKYIRECMDHILSQKTNFSWEILVGEDCSVDSTRSILEKEYSEKIHLIRRDKNVGLCKNLYDLLLRANGKYVYSFAGDDYFCENDALQKMVDFLEAHEEYYSVGALGAVYFEKEEKFYNYSSKSANMEYTLVDFLSGKKIPCSYGLMRNTFKKDRGSNLFLELGARNNEEMKMWLYTMSKGKKYVMSEQMYVYRVVDGDKGQSYNTRNHQLAIYKDYYGDLILLENLFKDQYNFRPLINLRCYKFYNLMSGNLRNRWIFIKNTRKKDLFYLYLYFFYLISHKGRNPIKWENRSYLIYD